MILRTDGAWTGLQNACQANRSLAGTVLRMNMSQLVIGTALGFMVAQGVLYSAKCFLAWVQGEEVRQRIRKLIPSRGSSFLGGLIRNAGLIGASAALITLCVWSARDYLAEKSARTAAMANVPDPSTAALESDPHSTSDEAAGLARARKVDLPAPVAVENVDPYADSSFQVQRRSHHAGKSMSLKETLVRRSEERARTDLLKETQQHTQRSQYDCEAADRASRYVKAGLDVWGFARWQVKYFPVESYTGATLPQCKDIKNVLDASWRDLQSTVAQANRP